MSSNNAVGSIPIARSTLRIGHRAGPHLQGRTLPGQASYGSNSAAALTSSPRRWRLQVAGLDPGTIASGGFIPPRRFADVALPTNV
jgi:hypothetical protein